MRSTPAAIPIQVRRTRVEAGRAVRSVAESASANSRAVPNRSVGVFSRARIRARSTDGGTLSRSRRTDVGRSVSSFAMIARLVDPLTGGSPASISYVTAPSE